MIKTIRMRIVVYTILLLLLLMSIIAAFVSFLLPTSFYNKQIDLLETNAKKWILKAPNMSDEAILADMEILQMEMGGQLYVDEINASSNGNGYGYGKRGFGKINVPGDDKGDYIKEFYTNKLGVDVFSFSMRLDEGVVFYEVTIEKLNKAVTYMVRSTMLLLGVSLILGIFLSRILANRISRPIRRLTRLAESMKTKDAEASIVTETQDELLELNHSINQMYMELIENIEHLEFEIEHVKAIENAKKVFLASAAHELKTPIAIVRGYSELLVDGMYSDLEEQADYFQNIYDESEKITRLLEDLMDYAKVEKSPMKMNLEKVNLSRLCRKLIGIFENVSLKGKLRIETHIEDDIMVYGDALRLEQVIKNLMNNAIEHTQTYLRIVLKQESGNMTLKIYNEGQMLSNEALEKVFDVFYKGDSRKKGHGLGLSIVKEIVLQHQGKVALSNVEKGVCVSVTLPAIERDINE